MKIALIADIHANRQAWTTTYADLCAHRPDRIVCLGDIIGYGPNPADVLEALYSTVDHFLAGNHDAALCSRIDPANFNDAAREILEWTRAALDPRALRFLEKLPAVIEGPGFACTHADPADPMRFGYILTPEDARRAFDARPEPVLFIGHSHVPAIFAQGLDGTVRTFPPQDFAIEPGTRYLINVGSVGLPRDGDPRAAYCIFNSTARTVRFHRVPFDAAAYRRELQRHGLPDTAAAAMFEAAGRLQRRPVRELVDFHPPEPTPPGAGPRKIRLRTLAIPPRPHRKKPPQRRRRIAAAVAGLAILAVLAALGLHHRTLPLRSPKPAAAPRPSPVPALEAPPPGQRLLFRLGATPGLPAGWRLQTPERERQKIFIDPTSPVPVIHCVSKTQAAELRLQAPAVRVKNGFRGSGAVQIKWPNPIHGEIRISLRLRQTAGSASIERALVRKTIHLKAPRRWNTVSVTMPLPVQLGRSPARLRLTVTGRFTGEVLLRKFMLVSRK